MRQNRCESCGAQVQEGDRFCRKCGKPVLTTPKQVSTKRRSGLVWLLVAATVALIILTVVVVVRTVMPPSGTREEPAQEAAQGMVASDSVRDCFSIRVVPQRSNLHVGDSGELELKVTLPKEHLGDVVTLMSADGTTLAEIGSSAFAEDASGLMVGTATITLDTNTDSVQRVYAQSGDHMSGNVALYVTPAISDEQVMESFQVGADLVDWIASLGIDAQDYEEMARRAEERLSADGRVSKVERFGTNVWYATTSKVAGMYEAAPRDPSLAGTKKSDASVPQEGGISDDATMVQGRANDGVERTFTEGSTAVHSFDAFGQATIPFGALGCSPSLLSAGNTITNGNVAVLVTWGGGDFDGFAESVTGTIQELCNVSSGDKVDFFVGEDMASAILSGSLTNYGTVIMATHGGILSSNVRPGERAGTFEMDRIVSDDFSERAAWVKTMRDRYWSMYEAANPAGTMSFNDLFYAGNNVYDMRIYMSTQDAYTVMDATTPLFEYLYGSRGFDNTVFHMASCNGLYTPDFGLWLLQNGCKAVLGYSYTEDIDWMQRDILATYGMAARASQKDAWRTAALKELDKRSTTEAGEHSLKDNLWDVLRFSDNMLLKIKAVSYAPTNGLSYLTDSDEHFYCGSSSLQGTVFYEAVNKSAQGVPASGAKVEAYRYLNQSFSLKGETQCAADGSFAFESLPSGLYVVKVSDVDGNTKEVSIVLDQQTQNGGTIVLPATILTVHLQEKNGRPVGEASVSVHMGDELVQASAEADESGTLCFKAPIHRVACAVEVVPTDERLIPQTVGYEPSADPGEPCELTVVLQEYITIRGRVFNAEDGSALSGVTVSVTNTQGETRMVTTDSSGAYEMDKLVPDSYEALYAKEGFKKESQTFVAEGGELALSDVYLEEVDDVEDQIELIAANKSMWNMASEYQEASSCMICDLDHDGLLEIIAKQTGGSGRFTSSVIFEVNQDITGLEKREVVSSDEAFPDWFNASDGIKTFELDGRYAYMVEDYLRGGYAVYIIVTEELILEPDGVHITNLRSKNGERTSMDSDYAISYADGQGAEISEEDYNAMLPNRYAGWHERLTKLKSVSRDQWESDTVEALWESWEGFSVE